MGKSVGKVEGEGANPGNVKGLDKSHQITRSKYYQH